MIKTAVFYFGLNLLLQNTSLFTKQIWVYFQDFRMCNVGCYQKELLLTFRINIVGYFGTFKMHPLPLCTISRSGWNDPDLIWTLTWLCWQT